MRRGRVLTEVRAVGTAGEQVAHWVGGSPGKNPGALGPVRGLVAGGAVGAAICGGKGNLQLGLVTDLVRVQWREMCQSAMTQSCPRCSVERETGAWGRPGNPVAEMISWRYELQVRGEKTTRQLDWWHEPLWPQSEATGKVTRQRAKASGADA